MQTRSRSWTNRLARVRSPALAVMLGGTLLACGGTLDETMRGDAGPPRDAGPTLDDGGRAASTDSGSAADSSRPPEADGGRPIRTDGPDEAYMPTVFGTCPEFVGPEITLETSRGPRPVKIWISEAAETLDGPLVFYWHGWHGSPGFSGMTGADLDRLLAMGGIFVAAYTDPEDEDEYWSSRDIVTADQVVACAREQVGIDERHIHSIGYSAGGMQTYRFSHERSGYVASSILYSPGIDGRASPMFQESTARFASMISWGDTEDTIFMTLAESYASALTARGHFAAICHHTGGHIQPGAMVAVALDFLLSHPYGTIDSPFAAGFPDTYPDYCTP